MRSERQGVLGDAPSSSIRRSPTHGDGRWLKASAQKSLAIAISALPPVMPALGNLSIHWSVYPRTYVAPRAPTPIDFIDGDLSKDVWNGAPWSDLFDDIRGPHDAPQSDRPRPACATRVKMMWDDEYLYIGALLHSDMTTIATYTERNSPIFQRDSDFEVFIDPLGSCHQYKEYEVNALGTFWNLMLDRPYHDGGQEHSGRIAKPGDDLYYDVARQRSATRVLEGSLNDPNGGATWSVEIAMAFSDILAHIAEADRPGVGSHWRINFSRVEHQGEINWTWQPQIAWNAKEHHFRGYVDMHLPDAWGYLIFGNSETNPSVARDPTWPSRMAAMNVYYAQHQFKNDTGTFAVDVNELFGYLDKDTVTPFVIEIEARGQGKSSLSDGWVATVRSGTHPSSVSVTDERLVLINSFKADVGVE